MFTIGITTFKRRYVMVERLISQIKQYCPNVEIILAVNADYQEEFDDCYRKKILNLCACYSNIFPVIFPTFTSLSKMWNTIIINASNEYILVLNDDVEVENEQIFMTIEKKICEIETKISQQLFKINGSFSFFVCSKAIIDELGYFDERLLAFGEEDGDMTWRFISKYKKEIESIEVQGIHNQQEGYLIAHPNMQIEDIHHRRLVPKFNRDFAAKKYHKSYFGIKGMFSEKKRKRIRDYKQYPYESFKRENYEKM